MSLGMDGRWREAAVRAARLEPGDAALDVCCGTGDLAIELRRAVGPGGRVVGLDFSEQMLDVARAKSAAVEWMQGDALELPFADGEFAAATVGWGVRNLADREAIRSGEQIGLGVVGVFFVAILEDHFIALGSGPLALPR